MPSIDSNTSPLQVPPALRAYAQPEAQYLNDQGAEGINSVYVSGLIFATASSGSLIHRHEDYVLLIQEPAESGSTSGLWDVPGGPCEPNEPSIIHSCTRSIREGTGLHAISVSALFGSHTIQDERGSSTLRLDFEVQVQEAPNRPLSMSDIPIELKTSSYSSFAWATQKQLENGEYQLTSGKLKEAISVAFAHRKDSKDARELNLWFGSEGLGLLPSRQCFGALLRCLAAWRLRQHCQVSSEMPRNPPP